MNVVPFRQGDMHGKRELAIEDAKVQAAMYGGIRQQLYALQEATGALPEVDCPLQHQFAPGVYMRTIFIPAGTVIVGKIHKHSHANVLSQGVVSVMTEDGGLEQLKGPLSMVSPAGCKRAVYAHTDVVWTTIHCMPTDTQDLEEIERHVIAKDFEEYEQFRLQEETMKQIEVTA
jgi:hypothetical protein